MVDLPYGQWLRARNNGRWRDRYKQKSQTEYAFSIGDPAKETWEAEFQGTEHDERNQLRPQTPVASAEDLVLMPGANEGGCPQRGKEDVGCLERIRICSCLGNNS